MSTIALRRLCRPLALASACALISVSSVGAANGVASGKVGLIDAGTQAFGFSASTNLWTPRNLDSPAAVLLSGEFLGYIRTQAKILLYNSTNDRWVAATYAGTPLGEEVEGATGVFWSTTTLYGSAAHWTVWKTTPVPSGETPIGGGSAGSFGLVWSSQNALAFHAAPGTWISQALDGPCLGGIASDGLGLVWTPTSAYSFDPALGTWTHLDLGATNGVSVAGSGDVALVWGDAEAQAYSGVLGSWFPYTDAGAIEGGAASGEIGLFWSAARALLLQRQPRSLELDRPAGSERDRCGRSFREPASSRDPPLAVGASVSRARPGDGAGATLDPAGREVRAGDVGPGSSERWDRSSSGAPLTAGVYWLEARRAGRVESRRAVILGS
ncbi:MAG: hypothetical protein IPK72_19610 [Candidatus Eisenbacteria bacterium]|nr:hypothetical protein [Candidatus Eisenbacteria bacterium]